MRWLGRIDETSQTTVEVAGRLATTRLPPAIVRVTRRGKTVPSFESDDRVGVGWIHHSSSKKNEKLSSEFVATGCDLNGGYAQLMTVLAR